MRLVAAPDPTTSGSAIAGSAKRLAYCSAVAAAMPDPVAVVSMPAPLSMRYWSVAPAAAPAGTACPSEFDVSCAVATANHFFVRNASASRYQMQTKLKASETSDAPIHSGARLASLGNCESVAVMLGSSR